MDRICSTTPSLSSRVKVAFLVSNNRREDWKWFSGTVTALNEHSFNVLFDDGEKIDILYKGGKKWILL
jgi:hypothetical protein